MVECTTDTFFYKGIFSAPLMSSQHDSAVEN